MVCGSICFENVCAVMTLMWRERVVVRRGGDDVEMQWGGWLVLVEDYVLCLVR